MKDEFGTSFDCFGGTCAAYVIGAHAQDAVAHAQRRLLAWRDDFAASRAGAER